MPRGLPKKVRLCLEKAKDSALLAVEMYNKPAIKFKSGGYVVLMVISWTTLFHAIFFRDKLKPFYKKNRRFIKKDNDYCYWELKTCLKEYFQDDSSNPIKKNLEFFIPLRNMIEHKSLPQIDSNIFAECQSLLLNFDKILSKEFGSKGEKYLLKESLSFALQLYPSSSSLNKAVSDNPTSKNVVEFIKSYRSSITTEVLESGEYSFKAFLIQVGNHQSSNTLPIQFVRYDTLDETEKKNVNRVAALVKNKSIKIPVSNLDKIKPKTVVERVQAGLGNPKVQKNGRQRDKFNMDAHTRCWKHFDVRPVRGANNPEQTKSEYCIYDSANENYLYSDDWVDFLIDNMKNNDFYKEIYN